MRLKYSILWFENEPTVVDRLRLSIKKHLEELGFDADIIVTEDGSILDSMDPGIFDLILTDLNLDGGQTGDRIIEGIRANSIYTEVLLYSANDASINNLIEQHKMIERVSFQGGLRELGDKIIFLIDLTLKKVQDLNNLRGLMIAEAISLEETAKVLLLSYFQAIGPDVPHKVVMSERIYNKRINDAENSVKQLRTRYSSSEMLVKMIEDEALLIQGVIEGLISVVKAEVTRHEGILGQSSSLPNMEEHSARIRDLKLLRPQLEEFKEEIITTRNTLAHVKEAIGENGPYLESRKSGGEPVVIDNAYYVKLRKDIRKHRESLALLEATLRGL